MAFAPAEAPLAVPPDEYKECRSTVMEDLLSRYKMEYRPLLHMHQARREILIVNGLALETYHPGKVRFGRLPHGRAHNPFIYVFIRSSGTPI